MGYRRRDRRCFRLIVEGELRPDRNTSRRIIGAWSPLAASAARVSLWHRIVSAITTPAFGGVIVSRHPRH